MKKILLLMLFVAVVSQLKAQTIVSPPSFKFPSAGLYKKYMDKGADSLTGFFPGQPRQLLTLPDSARLRKLVMNQYAYVDNMPVVKMQGSSKMPIVKMQGNSKMPVVNLDGQIRETKINMVPKP